MSNSTLIDATMLSPYCSARTAKIDRITIHHMAWIASVEDCGEGFAQAGRNASSNYGIGKDGRVGLYVPENKRAWTSSSSANDNRAVTIEVSNDELGGDWHVSDVVVQKLILLCADICKRNGIEKLNYTGDTSGNLTKHCWFAATACPGPYLGSLFPYIAEEVNKRLVASEDEPADWAKDDWLYAVNKGYLDGKRPYGVVTRQELAAVIRRMEVKA
jgi:N-acetylmuramoyl-L-alanine amidase